MLREGFDIRVKTSQIVQNQLPRFIGEENTNFVEFLTQYYLSQEFQGGPTDILDNLDQYLNLDILTEDIVSRTYSLTQSVNYGDEEIYVDSTLGFPDEYGLLKINNEIISYKEKTATSFSGCLRGFSGIEAYEEGNYGTELVFKSTEIDKHQSGDTVENLSNVFLKQFYKKIKGFLTPELENLKFVDGLNVGTFLKESSTLYKTKGTEESFRILFNVLYGITPSILNLEEQLVKPSSADYIRRKVIFGELLEGLNPDLIVGQTLVSSDGTANGPISEIEIVKKRGKFTYKISLFEGYDDRSLINGTFNITASSKVIGNFPINSKTLSVDSTIGFPESGTILCGDNTITYTEKTVNQFLNCSGILNEISDSDSVRDPQYVYAYENGDITKIVRFSVSNILSEINFPEDTTLTNDDESITVINLGDNVVNPQLNKTYKELLFNSWIYNTSSRYQIESSESNTTHTTKDLLDKSSMKKGDEVEIVDRRLNTVYGIGRIADATNYSLKLESYVNISGVALNTRIVDVKRRLKYASSSSEELKYPNLLANIQNVYSDGNDYAYVATNSLPDFEIKSDFASRFIDNADNINVINNSIIFPQIQLPLPFITGDEVIYIAENEANPITGLTSGRNYFIKIVSEDSVRLYVSKSFIYTDKFIEISVSQNHPSGKHSLTLLRQYNKKITSSKSLRKITLKPKTNNGQKELTTAGKPVGMLVNGTEIISYKGTDEIYYGPISGKTIYNNGTDYDVIDAPMLSVSSPQVSTGATSFITPVLEGSVKSILLDTPEVEVNTVSFVRIVGGNGSGCILDPIIERKQSQFEFDALNSLNVLAETITFAQDHNLTDGQEIIYNANGNSEIGIGTYYGSNADQSETLLDGGSYYAKVFNSNTIQLYGNQSDYKAGINTIGFTTTGNRGIHKFRTIDFKNVLVDIKVESEGSGYTNRNLIVKPEGISAQDSKVKFTNHGFKDGELVKYTSDSPISGLSTTNQYYVLKLNDNEFKLANAGVGGTITTEYERRDYVRFTSTGTGYQKFNYPDIQVDIGVSYATTSRTIVAKPLIKGSIIDAYVYEEGSDYGSVILNYHNRPAVTVKQGKDGSVRPVIINGRIIDVVVETTGSEFFSKPDLIVNSSTGTGVKLNPVISGGKLVDVIVIKSGAGYSANDTIQVKASGSSFNIDLNVRELKVNALNRFGSEYLNSFGTTQDDEVLYSVLGYNDTIRESLSDNRGSEEKPDHSPIIGWAYDGNPIYGPFGYTDPSDSSAVSLLKSGYKLRTDLVKNRPVSDDFGDGFFVEDYVYDGSGDLDVYNGRYAKTPEFPNGIYAYYGSIEANPKVISSFIPQFPYFIGNFFKSKFEEDVFDINQTNYDFSTGKIQRNTFPYRIGSEYSSTDYVDFVYDKGSISATVEEASRGGVTSFNIIDSGSGYKVGDTINVDNTETGGSGASAIVKSVKGKTIDNISTISDLYESATIIKRSFDTLDLYIQPYHDLNDQSFITLYQPSFFTNPAEIPLFGTRKDPIHPQTQQTKITYSSGFSGAKYGSAVAIGNSTLVVANDATIGAVYAYDMNGGNEVIISASDFANDDAFGISVAVGNNKIVVGASSDDDGGNATGSVYVYNLDGTGEVKITASDAAEDDQFGRSVDVGDNKIVVGAFNDNSSAGSAYIYNLDGTGEVKITASDADPDDTFGRAVAIGHSKVVIGAPFADETANNTGTVYIFDQDGTNQVKVTASDNTVSTLNRKFGEALAVGSNKIVVGAPGVENEKGAVYIYNMDGTGEVKIQASDGIASDKFGSSVAISDNYVIVGAWGDDDDGSTSGSAYIYNLDGTNERKVTASNAGASDRFGYAVAVGANVAIVGAPYEDADANNAGAIYRFTLDAVTIVPTFEIANYGSLREVSIPGLSGIHKIDVSKHSSILVKEIPATTVGIITDIYVAEIPSNVSIGSSIKIGTEVMSILNKFNTNRILRVHRNAGGIHTETSKVDYLPESFSIKLSTENFESNVNRRVYFNPTESVGVGTTSGLGLEVNYSVGELSKSVSVETSSIFIPDHPFEDNQRVRLHRPSSAANPLLAYDSETDTSEYFPASSDLTKDFYIVNKGIDFIGLATAPGRDQGLYFEDNGTDSYEYFFEIFKPRTIVDAEVISTTVTTSVDHGLVSGDIINLELISDQNVGIAFTETSVNVKYNNEYNKLLLSTVGFGSEVVNPLTNRITLQNHKYSTGDKVFYDHSNNSSITGLSTGEYYVVRIDKDKFNLSETYKDTIADPQVVVSFGSTGGGSQSLSLINPSINVTKNDTLIFDVGDASLENTRLEFFYDNRFINEFVSTGSTNQFNVQRIGTPGAGIGTNIVSIRPLNGIDTELFYSLRKGTEVISSDLDVVSYSSIKTKESDYTGKHTIIGSGTTTFNIVIKNRPERISYASSEISSLKYTTSSTGAVGGISEIRPVFEGIGYEKLPRFTGFNSTTGINAKIQLDTTNIGKINDIKIKNEGIIYPSDFTLAPQGRSSLICNIIDNQEITRVDITFGGRNYYTPPSFVCVDSASRKVIEGVAFKATLSSGSITDVDIISSAKGLASVQHELFTVNNTNGINIRSLTATAEGLVTATLSTPIVGFSTFAPPFAIGDEVFVEGIAKTSGKGFNSEDYGHKFFKVTDYQPTNPAVVIFDIGEDPGVAEAIQSFATIINKKEYPVFNAVQENSTFFDNESILLNYGAGFFKSDYIVDDYVGTYIKLKGKGAIQNNIEIKGEKSGSIAKVENFSFNDGNFVTSATASQVGGWNNETGLLSFDQQVIEDNDYYQSLSYSIRSSVPFDQLSDTVNRIVHPTGLKNFADVQIENSVSVDVINQSKTVLIADFINDARADQRNGLDLVLDSSISDEKTRDIRFLNKKLTDYFKCKTNRVLPIDDISGKFSSKNFGQETYANLAIYPDYVGYSRFLIQTIGVGNTNFQIDDVVVLNDKLNAYTVNRGQIGNTYEPFIEHNGNMDQGVMYLRAQPEDPENSSYTFKSIRGYHNTSQTGIGTTSVGKVKLTTKSEKIESGISTNFSVIQNQNTNGLMIEAFVRDLVTNDINFIELAIDHDGNNAYVAEYFIDSVALISGTSGIPIGSFGATINSGYLNVSYDNNSSNPVELKSKTYNFEPTQSAGITTYRFKPNSQPDGSERTARYETRHKVVAIATDATNPSEEIVSIDINLDSAFKSILKINHDDQTSIHQVLVGYDGTDTYVLPKYYVSIGNTTGLGTFSATTDSQNIILKFHPEPGDTGRYDITSYSEILYRELDRETEKVDLEYGTIEEEVLVTKYNSINGLGNDQLEFELKYDETPIFAKSIAPSSDNINQSTGLITIKDHFFSPGEELIYTPGSTYAGVSSSPIGIGTTQVGGTIFTGSVITGVSTISATTFTDATDKNLIEVGQTLEGEGITSGSTIVSIGQTFQYFVATSTGNTTATGIAATSIFATGANVFGSNGTSVGSIVSIGADSITLDANFPSGTATYYTDNLGFGISMSNAGTATTITGSYSCGLTTDKMPSRVYCIRFNADTFKLTGVKNSGIGFTFTDYGQGNDHMFEMKKKNEKSLIAVDNITQYPILYTEINHTLGIPVNDTGEFITLTGISSINPRDIVKVDDEYMKIVNVGLATQAAGPITGIGNFNLIEVTRGVVGSAATSHAASSEARVYHGSYNIVGDKIFFLEAPKGVGDNDKRDSRNLPLTKSTFSGRVFLRNDYSKNLIYDDISPKFTGIGQTFDITYEGQEVDYIEPGSGILFINEIFQTPTTENNAGNNYELESTNSTSDITFTGIKSPLTNQLIISDYDVNQNALPRGGVIVSLGSTSGLGYAPLIGSKVAFDINGSGTIVGVKDSPSIGESLGIVTAQYDNVTGILTVTTQQNHYFNGLGDYVYLDNLEFSCTKINVGTPNGFTYDPSTGISTISFASAHGLVNGDAISIDTDSITFTCTQGPGNHTYPRATDPANGQYLTISNVSANSFQVNVGTGGTGTSPHTFVSATANAIKTLNYQGFTTSFFPDGTLGNIFPIISTDGTTSFAANIGISTIPHIYEGGGQAFPHYPDLTSGSGYYGEVSIGITFASHTGSAANITATVGAGGSLSYNIVDGGSGYSNAFSEVQPPSYGALEVVGVSRLGSGITTETGSGLLLDLNVEPSERRMPDRFSDAANLILRNKLFIADVAVGKMLAQYPSFSVPGGDQNCKDDVVDVIESIAYNLEFSGNGNVYDSANLYITGAHVAGEEAQSITAFEEAKTAMISAMRNEAIDNTAPLGGSFAETSALIEANRTLLIDESIDRMLLANPTFFFPAGPAACRADVNLIIDAILTNLSSGGNNAVYDIALTFANNATDAYLAGAGQATLSDEIVQNLEDLLRDIAQNITFNITGASSETQVTNPSMTVDAAVDTAIQDLITILRTAINANTVSVTRTSPSLLTSRIQYFDNTITTDPAGIPYCANVASAIDSFVGIVTFAIGNGTLPNRTPSFLEQFEVKDFKIARNGYNFRRGDKLTAVGLVTAAGLSAPVETFELEVLGTFQDSAALWQFGELDFIDSIKPYQTEPRTRFPLYRNNELISFEIDKNDPDSVLIDLEALLLVFVNGILQEPNKSYNFFGGTSIIFVEPIRPEDEVDIFFYRGTRGKDSFLEDVSPDVQIGDFIRINKNNEHPTSKTQEERIIFDILESDLIETNVYSGTGINTTTPRPITLLPQKRDRIINSVVVSKKRQLLSSQIYPISRVIKSITQSDTEIFVDDAQQFFYEEGAPISQTISSVGGLLVDDVEVSQASITPSLLLGGVIKVSITNSGSGYETPPTVGFTGGLRAQGTAVLSSSGLFKRFVIDNPGSNFTYPPVVTFGGGLAAQSATASIGAGGTVTGITLDGITLDTSDNSNIYEFGSGTSIVPNGSGSGTTGGFSIGSPHLRFGGSSGTRFVTFNPIDSRSIDTVRVYAIRGNDTNGGETPDIQGIEDLRIQYQITDQGVAVDNGKWIDMGIVISAIDQGSGAGVLENYDFTLTSEQKSSHVYFRLFQEDNSGSDYDHYGILSITFLSSANAEIPESTITLTKNLLEPNPAGITDATASIILGRKIDSVTMTDFGEGYTVGSNVSFTGGNFDSAASAEVGQISGYVESLSISSPGSGYNPNSQVTLEFTVPTDTNVDNLITASGVANVGSSGTVTSATLTNSGIGYTQIPFVSAPVPPVKVESITGIDFIQGFAGIITGITQVSGVGTALGLQFDLQIESGDFLSLSQGYPIYVYDTHVGSGVTSIDTTDSQTVGIGTTFLDNIYYVHSITRDGVNAVVTANVKSDSNITGISTTGLNLGKFSWGRLDFSKRGLNAIAIDISDYTAGGLSTYPQIQRRGYGLRNTGSLSY